ncbi:hypothetical protein X801_10156 [Opisthorchis viverrini]|nr:hypothetical protein X801_10156 [Opisthorchis viverrini]
MLPTHTWLRTTIRYLTETDQWLALLSADLIPMLRYKSLPPFRPSEPATFRTLANIKVLACLLASCHPMKFLIQHGEIRLSEWLKPEQTWTQSLNRTLLNRVVVNKVFRKKHEVTVKSPLVADQNKQLVKGFFAK